MVDTETVLNHVELDINIELYINIVTTTDNYVVAGLKVQHVILIHAVHQHMDQVDTGQDVQKVVVQERKIITVIVIVTTQENIVQHHIVTPNLVIHTHAVHQHTDQVDTGLDARLHVVEDGKIITVTDIVTIQENTVLHHIHMDKVVTLTHAVHMYITQLLEHIVHQQVNILEYHGKI